MNGRRLKLVGGLTVALAVIGGLGATGAVAAPGTPGGPRYTAGALGRGRRLLPLRRQRRVRRAALRPRRHLHAARPRSRAARGAARGHGDDRPRRHPGPRPVQPRPPRHAGELAHGERQARDRDRAPGSREPRSTAPRTGTSRTTRRASGSSPCSRARRSRRARACRSSSSTAARPRGPSDIEGALYGWVTTRDGAMVVSEPEGSMTWYPVSDHQTDKASYSFAITVPEGKVAVANGVQSEPEETDRRLDHLVLGRPRPAGQLPHDRVGRRLRTARRRTSRRAACRSSMRSTRTSRRPTARRRTRASRGRSR